jgi:acyl-CoA reductase-like NAD-dependent aldehyde dehydrogenase
MGTTEVKSKRILTAAELRKLPRAERDALLARAAEAAEEEYQSNAALTAFEAFDGETADGDDSGARDQTR